MDRSFSNISTRFRDRNVSYSTNHAFTNSDDVIEDNYDEKHNDDVISSHVNASTNTIIPSYDTTTDDDSSVEIFFHSNVVESATDSGSGPVRHLFINTQEGAGKEIVFERGFGNDLDVASHDVVEACGKLKAVGVSEMIDIVGPYGRYQKIVNLMLFLLSLTSQFHIYIVSFIGDRPDWRCADNSSVCRFDGSFPNTDNRRCRMPRAEWTYVVGEINYPVHIYDVILVHSDKDYSVQTEYDVVCERDWLISLSTTMFFMSWLIGSVVTGWCADNYGRRTTMMVSVTVVTVTGFACVWMPNFYLFIACRSVVGFFSPGTFLQMFILISEIVGDRYRSFAGLSIYLAGAVASCILCLKAYFIRHWAYLYMACTAPYIPMLLFFAFIPESTRFLRVKGRCEEAMGVFRRMAHWNGETIPSDVVVSAPPKGVVSHHASPLDLFRTWNMAKMTMVQGLAWFASGMTFIGLYLVAAELGRGLYVDYLLVTVAELLGALVVMDLTERVGRKVTVMAPMVMGSAVCVAIGFIPIQLFPTMRLVFGMLGKLLLGMAFNGIHTWSMELYPTNIRGEGMGFLQVCTRCGTASAPWVTQELKTLFRSAPYITMGAVSFLSFVCMFSLAETKGTNMKDTDSELEEKIERIAEEEGTVESSSSSRSSSSDIVVMYKDKTYV